MNNPQHTPGPWKVDGGTNKQGDLFIWKDGNYQGGCSIAKVNGKIQEDTLVNAHLIAKAPEMLDCLRELIEADDSNDANIMHVVAIKAELLLRGIESNT